MNQIDWNQKILAAAPRSGAFLQSWQWGEFQERVGREVRRYDGVQVVQYPIRAGWYGWTAYRGSFKERGTRNEELGLLDSITNDLKKTKGVFLHLEPAQNLVPSSQFLPSKNHQPQKTTILDLTKSEEELLASMHEKTRYNIRLAERHGVIVNHLDATDPPSFVYFWKMMQETAARQKFHLHAQSYYSTMLKVLHGELDDSSRATAHLYLATKDGRPLASLLGISFAGTMTYLHGATSDAEKNLMAPYALHWGVIRNAKAHGATAYDFWGIDEKRWPGVTRFKMGFGGEVVSSPPALELPLRPFWYKLYRVGQLVS